MCDWRQMVVERPVWRSYMPEQRPHPVSKTVITNPKNYIFEIITGLRIPLSRFVGRASAADSTSEVLCVSGGGIRPGSKWL